MNKIILGASDQVAAYAAQKLGKPMGALSSAFVPPYVALGVGDYDELRGALIFNGFDHFGIEMTVVGEHCWTRQIIRFIFDYVFNDLNCIRLTVHVRASKPEHEALAKRLGFVREGVVRCKYGSDDGILMGMLRNECRWLKGKPQ